MTTRASYHVETANVFLAHAHASLREGDLLQASEKGWGAASRMVKAVAETRGWRNSTHGHLYDVVNRLAEETGDQRVPKSLPLGQRAAPELLRGIHAR